MNDPPTSRCPVCGKKIYRSWTHARNDAKALRHRRTENKGEQAYWSRRCQAIHVGRQQRRRKRRRIR